MSKLFSELAKETERQQETLKKHKDKDVANESGDVKTSVSDIGNRHQSDTIDKDKLGTIISELSEIKVSTYGTPVRLSEVERKDIDDFIYITLRKKGIGGKAVSSAKLMRYALRYLMKVHDKAFVETLVEALEKEERLSI